MSDETDSIMTDAEIYDSLIDLNFEFDLAVARWGSYLAEPPFEFQLFVRWPKNDHSRIWKKMTYAINRQKWRKKKLTGPRRCYAYD